MQEAFTYINDNLGLAYDKNKAPIKLGDIVMSGDIPIVITKEYLEMLTSLDAKTSVQYNYIELKK